MTERLILVVEDDDDLRTLLASVIADDSAAIGAARVIAVGSADEALLTLRALIPDLIMLDLRLPGMDGFELCRRLKLDPVIARVPVVAVSAMAPVAEAERRAIEAGCVEYVAKPFDLDALSAVVARHLGAPA
jgi:CheY-like chemotaxis protein